MSDIAIKVEELGKLYRLGEIGSGTISHDLNRWWAKVRGKEDPFAKVGETNDRTKRGDSEYVWALKDVSFEVRKGEVLGIIGRNGAGKSTLLKMLSKVTTPSKGKIKVKGRIASLLEVGTGFHPELTGRENVFLNGAILGMSKFEIERKFDEIVAFSGVERYIDTPVKRYSSGMYVRLAFAVAAYLEPEILVVDEVLAVGDAEFQKKCLGRMKDVSVNDGRTVLFVSHNLSAVQQLCTSAILIQQGGLAFQGSTPDAINLYANEASNSFYKSGNSDSDKPFIKEVFFVDEAGSRINQVTKGEPFGMKFKVANNECAELEVQISVWDIRGNVLWNFNNTLFGEPAFPGVPELVFTIYFNPPPLNVNQLAFHFGLNYKDKINELFDNHMNELVVDVVNPKIDYVQPSFTIFNSQYKIQLTN